jgi:bla regulator protein blaR1
VAITVRKGSRVDDGREVEMLRRLERLWSFRRPLPVVSSEAALEPGVFGICSPVLLWPRRITARLADEQIEAILAHELSHLRRGDNLVAAVHMVVQAVFWFHPLIWWLGAQLVHEREMACDEDVIRSGRDPHVYASSILKTCEFCIESPAACIAGVTGADLKTRIETIMRGRPGAELGFWRKALLGSAAVIAVSTPLLIGILDSAALYAQSSPPVMSAPAFEVASVRPNTSGEINSRIGSQPGGRFVATNATLRMLIQNAYQLQSFQLAGAPGWIDAERFDIVAKADGPVTTPVPGGPPSSMQLMLRALLADRFKLTAHEETRELPIYALVLARKDGRLGPQLRQSNVDCAAIMAAIAKGAAPPAPAPDGRQPCHMRSGTGRLAGDGFPLSHVATVMSNLLERTVVDRTGLTGPFDVELAFTPDQLPPAMMAEGAPAIDAHGPSIFAAVQEQLGLKLESEKGPVTVLVIDRVERPAPE